MDGYLLIVLGVLLVCVGYLGKLLVDTHNDLEEQLTASQEWSKYSTDRFEPHTDGRD